MQKIEKKVAEKEGSMKKPSNTLATAIIIILISLIAVVSGGPTCGNEGIEGTEVCDGTNLDNKTCIDFGYSYGDVLCCPDCNSFYLFGCYNITNEPCFDGDNGNNYYVASNASQYVTFIYGPPCPLTVMTGEEGGGPGYWVIEDTCKGDILHEAVCDETTGKPQKVDYDCSSEGKECINGICVSVGVCENCQAGEQCLDGQCVESAPSMPSMSLLQRIINWILDIF
ncbi:hypothetical protein A3K73_06810 [Candidatus Pacearchaeota archaeon RBG_13_36_9]|nr:MAG: hypothetical protein A3K73_06810 [Candidatus Pacearchaeota archaeon RBG_13_36_9]